jgi:outer membrane protein assembly factor BamB
VDSSPAVAKGIVYFGSDEPKVSAPNETTGANVGTYGTGIAGDAVKSSPAVGNGPCRGGHEFQRHISDHGWRE